MPAEHSLSERQIGKIGAAFYADEEEGRWVVKEHRNDAVVVTVDTEDHARQIIRDSVVPQGQRIAILSTPEPERFLCTHGCCSITIRGDFDPYTDPRVLVMGIEHFRPAMLLRAAPDLLAAAKAIIAHIEMGYAVNTMERDGCIDALRNAIAKAEGR